MARSPRILLACGHVVSRRDHGFVSTDGRRTFDSQTCLDTAEGRTPQKFDRREEKPDNGGKTWGPR